MQNAAYYKLNSYTPGSVVDIDLAKRHLFIADDDSDDALIEFYINSAQSLVQDWINQPLTESSYSAFYQNLDPSGLVLPHPVYSALQVQYYDTASVLQTIASTNYGVDATDTFPRVYAPTGTYGSGINVNSNLNNPVILTYTTQLEALTPDSEIDYPNRVQQAILMYMTDLWNNRANEDTSSQNVSRTTVLTAKRLLSKYRPATL